MIIDEESQQLGVFLDKIGNDSKESLKSLTWSVDNFGMTGLHYAVRYSNIATIRTLIGFGADVNKHGKEGYTPLHFIAR